MIKYTGRVPVFIFAALINYVCICIMIVWKPNDESSMVLYLIAILWGLGDAVWQTQINGNQTQIFC